MINGPQDESHDSPDSTDPMLDALLRRADRGVPSCARDALDARIMEQASFALASRRRRARTSLADTLAAWVRIALPMAAAAAIVAAAYLTRLDTTSVAEAELRDSDPAALLGALESGASGGLTQRVIASDVMTTAASVAVPQ